MSFLRGFKKIAQQVQLPDPMPTVDSQNPTGKRVPSPKPPQAPQAAPKNVNASGNTLNAITHGAPS